MDTPSKSRKGPSDVAKKYEKMSPREHVMRRPDTYIGSIGVVEEAHNVINESGRIVGIDMAYTPGLAKIFDECLVNALDHVSRLAHTGGKSAVKVTEISVSVDKDTGVLSVYNNGDGIDVVEHPEHKIYVPQLVFGELLTSTNYSDGGDEKLWGGRNGYGAKLTNIWSVWFKVETFDKTRGLTYSQRFEKNMSIVGKPVVRSKKTGKPFTRVTFLPDYARMQLPGLSDNMASLLCRRVYDAAACTPAAVTVLLNDTPVPVKTFKDYVSLFNVDGEIATYSSKDGRWDIAVTASPDATFDHVSFVNGISTRKGGTHVNFVANMLVKTAVAAAGKKGLAVKSSYIKENMRLFLRCVVPDPTFSSQTKEELTSPSTKFSASLNIKDSDVVQLVKGAGIMERAEALVQFHENRKIKASAGKKQSRLIIPKLDDANNAGTKKSGQCTLILTEGDSAKTMAISGLAVVGRDDYGVFPLRGKLLNISDRSLSAALKNEEVANIVKILGLKPGQSNSIADLRYGKVMIMADADDDGIHIRALVMNLFRVMFPDLFRSDGFLTSMLTPVIKVRTAKEDLSFYSLDDFRKWRSKHAKTTSTVKYLKGLGSSSGADAKEYFRKMRVVEYEYTKESDDRMSLAFSKTRADDRKEWLMTYKADQNVVDYTREKVDYATFVDTELIRFSIRDCARSLPHVMDGLKESTRKILFGAMKHTPRDASIKVAQLAGFVSKVSKYLHGEDSLNKAITAMAQTFPGSNNLSFLDQDGQFGTRLLGGEDRASPRYIHTRLADLALKVFRPEDDVILEYKKDEGADIEPVTYYPIIPVVLANGVVSIATGFSSTVPMYNPDDLVTCVRLYLDDKKLPDLVPWFRSWKGTIQPDGKGGFVSHGTFSRKSDTVIVIEELPAYRWTEDQKVLLENLLTDGIVKRFKSQYTDTSVRFEVEFASGVSDEAVHKILQLSSNRNLSTSNIHMFSLDGRVTKFAGVLDLLRTWLAERLAKYSERKVAVLKQMRRDLVVLSSKARFISEVVDGTIKIMDVKSDTIAARLKVRKFPVDEVTGTYEYLLKMPINQLTRERRETLLQNEKALKKEVSDLEKTSPQDLWRKDLDEFQKAWKDVCDSDAKNA